MSLKLCGGVGMALSHQGHPKDHQVREGLEKGLTLPILALTMTLPRLEGADTER